MFLARTPDHAEHFLALALEALRVDGARVPRPRAFASGPGPFVGPRPEGARTSPNVTEAEDPPGALSAPKPGRPATSVLLDVPSDLRDVSIEPPHHWRARWCVKVRLRQGKAEGRGALISADAPRVRLIPPGEAYGPLQLEVGLSTLPGSLVPPTPPPGCERVLLDDAAFGRATRQSSVVEPDLPLEPTRWMRATRPEAAPWWELDLGQPLYVEAVRLRWDAPPGARVRLVLHSAPSEEGGPPRWPEAAWSTEVPAVRAVVVQPRTVARHVRVELEAPAGEVASLELASVEVLAARLLGETLEASLRRTFALFAARPLFSRRARDRGWPRGPVDGAGTLDGFSSWSTYADAWSRSLALAGGLAPVLAAHAHALEDPATARPRHAIGLWAPNQPEWVIADLACTHQAWVSVPLAAVDPAERVIPIVLQARLVALVVGTAQRRHLPAVLARCPLVRVVVLLPPSDVDEDPPREVDVPPGVEVHELEDLVRRGRALPQVEWAEREPEELHGVLFTSGSTGTPKGATRSYAGWNALLGAYVATQPPVHLSFQPLSHFSERVTLPVVMAGGGCVGFSPGGARLYDDIAALRPTFLAAVPRVFDVLHARYGDALHAARREAPDRPVAALEAELLPRFRALLGDRLQSIGVGSAAPTPALMEFLRRACPDIRVVEGYGSTECGGISVDDVVWRGVEVKLIDVPELGYRADDDPPRGEICVKTIYMVGGYLGDPETTAARFDADGFFHTGDLGRREPDGRVRIVGRRNDVIKLSQGEFVAPAMIEAALGHPLVEEVFVHAAPHQASVVALVVPRAGPLRAVLGPDAELDGPEACAVLLGALRDAARAAELLPFQVPSAVAVVLEPLPASANNKRDRRAIVVRHGERLAALQGDAVALPSVLDALRAAAAEVTGRELDPDADLSRQLGVDSLAGVELLAAAQSRLSRTVSLQAWYGATSLGDLARRIEADAGVTRVESVASSAASEAKDDLALEADLDPRTLEAARDRRADLGREVLLTGATGFLGAHLLDALVRRCPEARVHALVRAPDADAARARLRERFARGRIEWSSEHEARVVPLPGDLALPCLGLEPAAWAALEDTLDSILHAGAVVNWLLLYGQLRAPNVKGTLELLRLAGHGRPKVMHLVSTISTAPPDGDESTLLPAERALSTGPYALSKWIGERHARATAARGLPLVVYRPAMIAGHSVSGDCNADDVVNRYLIATSQLGVALDLAHERLDMTPVDLVADSIVAIAQRGEHRDRTLHVTNLRASLSYAALARALAAAGVPARPVTYADFRAALEARPNGLTPLRAFFPPRGFGLHMGPWPCPASEQAIAAAGIAARPVDDALVRTYVEALRRDGHIV